MVTLRIDNKVSASISQFANKGNEQATPFDLSNEDAYQAWRSKKLQDYPVDVNSAIVTINNPAKLTDLEKERIIDTCNKTNSVIYRCSQPVTGKYIIRQLGEQLGLHRLDENLCSEEDGISGLQVMNEGSRHEAYIPYTNKPINWHTDGYYNLPSEQIRAMLLHCVTDSATGGDNSLLDHEIVYLLMRDSDPEMIKAFMQKDVMTIPENIENNIVIREAQSGPVFSINKNDGHLHMRYTARTRSIEWKNDSATQKAVAFIKELLNTKNKFIFNYRLQPGEGVISNNALHNRTSFTDDEQSGKKRLLYRARYFDRVQWS